jgi:Amt family ammonium transporter
MLAATGLVLFMTPGLALFYGGMVRTRNVLGMLMQNVFCMALVSVLWVVVGFSLAFGHGLGGFVGGFALSGLHGVVRNGVPGLAALSFPPLLFVAYQMMFAVITPALITGATADRLRFGGWALFVGAWLLLVYCPVAHWVFAPAGWLARRGVLDFAGGTVVHINAGVAALAIVLLIGRRRGWPDEAMHPHSLPLTLLGTGILWFGWFGFNAGSALHANGIAATALLNTQVAAAAGMLGWLLLERVRDGAATTLGAASGAVAGLVAITPCAGYIDTWAAIAVGLVAGVVCVMAIGLKYRFGYDDALDVVGVHLVGGILGSVMVGVFATKAVNPAGADGLLYGGGLHLLGLQCMAVLVTMAFSFTVTFAIAFAIHKLVGLRVDEDDEIEGLDTTQHRETAYSSGGLGIMERLHS